MKYLLLILLFISDTTGPLSISEMNKLKEEAENAYKAGNWEKSAEKYSYIVDTLSVSDDKAIMNLANAYYKLSDSENALATYQRLQDSENPDIKSQAYQQLGVMSNDPKTLEKALAYFKVSLRSNPNNDDARYNYELVKKKLENQQDQNQDNQENQQDEDQQDQQEDQNDDQKEDQNSEKEQKQEGEEEQDKEGEQNDQGQQNDEQNSEEQQSEEQKGEDQEGDEQKNEPQQNGDDESKDKEEQEKMNQEESDQKGEQSEEQKEGAEKDEKESEQAPQKSTQQKLQEINISPEKAKMILEALRNSEIQYIQDQKRKPTKRTDSNKPDW